MIKLPNYLRNLFGTHGEIPARELNPPLFITGTMRSGTTFLVNKLASHPQLLKIGSELNDVWSNVGGAPIRDHCPHLTKSHASPYYTYQMTNYFSNFINESKSFKRHVMRGLEMTETNLFRLTYDWEHIVPMTKSPHLLNKLGYVHGLFPKSKFIVIIRDVFAHSASMKHHFLKFPLINHMPDDQDSCWSILNPEEAPKELQKNSNYPPNFELIPRMWIRLNHLALQEIQNFPKDQYLVVTYEDLVTMESETMQTIFDFLDLRVEHKLSEEKIKNLTAKKHNTSTKGNPLHKWKSQLKGSEIETVESVIKSENERYQYIIHTTDRIKNQA